MAAAIKSTWSTYPSILSGLIHYISPFLRKMLLYMKKEISINNKVNYNNDKVSSSKIRKQKLECSSCTYSSEGRISVHVPQRKLTT